MSPVMGHWILPSYLELRSGCVLKLNSTIGAKLKRKEDKISDPLLECSRQLLELP